MKEINSALESILNHTWAWEYDNTWGDATYLSVRYYNKALKIRIDEKSRVDFIEIGGVRAKESLVLFLEDKILALLGRLKEYHDNGIATFALGVGHG